MRSFVLYIDSHSHLIPIGSSDEESQRFATYNEKLTEAEHDQYTLTFSILAKSYAESNIVWNSNVSLLYIGAKLRLIIDNSKRIDLIISNIHPAAQELNTEWEITAQDEVSYLWSKHNISQTYSTVVDNILTPKNIYTITQELLEMNWLTTWSVVQKSQDAELANKFITLENVQNNPYQIIIQACNTVGALLSVNYINHTIDFYRKDLASHSGYRYHPSNTLNKYDASYSGEEITTWLHVHGGTDANGNEITMIPALPPLVYQYFHEAFGPRDIYNFDEQDNAWDVDTLYEYICYNEDAQGSRSFDRKALDEKNKQFWNGSQMPVNQITLLKSGKTTNLEPITPMSAIDIDTKKQITYIKYVIDSTKEPSPELKINIDYFLGQFPLDEETNPYYQFAYTSDNSNNNIQWENMDEEWVTNNHTIKLYINKQVYEDAIQNFYDKYFQAIQEFVSILQHVPHFGPYFIDFSPFKHCIVTTQWNNLYDAENGLLTHTLLKYNMRLQYYAQNYFELATQLTLNRKHIEETLGVDLYLSALDVYNNSEEHNSEDNNDADNSEENNSKDNLDQAYKDIETAQNKIKTFLNEQYFRPLQSLGLSNDLLIDEYCTAYWKQQIANVRERINTYQNAIVQNTNIDKSSNTIAQIYTDKINHLLMYISDQIILKDGKKVPGLYPLIIEYIQKYVNDKNNNINIVDGIDYAYVNTKIQINNNVWRILYIQYGQYIYENNYSNTDELDSIALYNQALGYFKDLNRIQSSHSLDVLDIESLEAITTPRLSVGSVISIYNTNTPQMQRYIPLLEKIEQAYGNNKHTFDLYKKQLTLAEQTQAKINIQNARQAYEDACDVLVTQYNQDNNTSLDFLQIEEQLYQDQVLVIGINRVLRQPLLDSVTVEQPSMYKTILAQLIQSI